MSKRYKILILSAEQSQCEYDISPAPLLIGRSHSCNIRFTAPDVSGRHVEILLDECGDPVMHNLSLRKTTVNGSAVAHESVTALHENDVIRLGDDVALKICSAGNEDITLADDLHTEMTIVPGDVSAGRTGQGPAGDNDGVTSVDNIDPDMTILPGDVSAGRTGQGPAGENDTPAVPDPAKTVVSKLPVGAEDPEGSSADQPAKAPAEPAREDGTKTSLMQTQMASPEEIELLRKRQNFGSRKKTFLYVFGALISAGIIAVGWVISATQRETELSWPLDAKGNFNDEVLFPNDDAGRSLLIYFPRHKQMKIVKKENLISAETRIGKVQDVELRLEFHASKLKDNLRTKREPGFRKWMEEIIRKGGKWNFDSISEIQFKGKGNGVPYQTAKYSRAVGGKSWFGIASYMKFRDWEFVLLKEIPTEERWRGERLLEREPFFSVSPFFVARHWEYGGQILTAPIHNLLEDARSMLDRTSPPMWPQISNILISVMIRSLEANDSVDFEKAQEMMAELREKQTNWLNSEKLEYFTAVAKNRYKDAQRIRENCRAMFSDENDQRYHFIRKDQWEN